jgi:hypothetical protein
LYLTVTLGEGENQVQGIGHGLGIVRNRGGEHLCQKPAENCWFKFFSSITSSFLKNILNDAGRLSNKVWHSLNMLGSSEFTHWTSGAELTYQTGWAAGSPAQFPNEACACFE